MNIIAWDMLKNADAAIIINREIDDTVEPEKQYMGFKLEKYRGRPNQDRIYVFLHPFDENNGILLNADIDQKEPISKLRIEDFNPMGPTLVSKGKPTFDDYDESANEFIESLKDIITDDYTDSAKNYVDLVKNAESVSQKMKRLNQAEKDLRDRRKRELKDHKCNKTDDNRIIIKSRLSNSNDIVTLDRREGYYVIKKRDRT